MAEELIGKYGYVGIALILILGGLGLPIPEEAPIIVAAILTRNGQMSPGPALASCLSGVLIGDFVVYLLGYCYGEKVLRLPLTRRLLTRSARHRSRGTFTGTDSRSWSPAASCRASARPRTSPPVSSSCRR